MVFCRYRSVVDLVKSWYYEKQHYSFPYPQECNPSCPSKCSGSVCSHYTQVGSKHYLGHGNGITNYDSFPEPPVQQALVKIRAVVVSLQEIWAVLLCRTEKPAALRSKQRQ